ncbi:hypothetical protein J3Q64DRAFT_1397803 [Phycomyces blakesleeanus]|uniref:Large ribosomal subunit protein mL50 n=2 Tax=Phycomyces blakesleeanus TaxID=4837 RepID=A0A163AXM1_PHYB8|nr:hypothetical protein PHYBLDRAFT_186307 [Phycomyces blakesleeanus NRRL 1555(-)]OAD76481.1 hypothetical protein PHYBLDRAFT_186307 [Phycomyces blakesleeanus NRRL 1555(-)]|eukprot:XP_018294521.1 hypothetical protein PHYBLDRAFT_186307 [Phycomyces blakesleeanus NRRL 1555(-)]
MLFSPIVRSTLQARAAFHTSAFAGAERAGVFGRFNPWAKKPEPEVVTPTSVETNENLVLDVKYDDGEEEIVSWKSTNIIRDSEEIKSVVRDIVLENISGTHEVNWESAALEDVETKFKIVKESIKKTGKEVPNMELNQIKTVGDLLDYYKRSEEEVIAASSIEKFFEDNQTELPMNMTFETRKKNF